MLGHQRVLRQLSARESFVHVCCPQGGEARSVLSSLSFLTSTPALLAQVKHHGRGSQAGLHRGSQAGTPHRTSQAGTRARTPGHSHGGALHPHHPHRPLETRSSNTPPHSHHHHHGSSEPHPLSTRRSREAHHHQHHHAASTTSSSSSAHGATSAGGHHGADHAHGAARPQSAHAAGAVPLPLLPLQDLKQRRKSLLEPGHAPHHHQGGGAAPHHDDASSAGPANAPAFSPRDGLAASELQAVESHQHVQRAARSLRYGPDQVQEYAAPAVVLQGRESHGGGAPPSPWHRRASHAEPSPWDLATLAGHDHPQGDGDAGLGGGMEVRASAFASSQRASSDGDGDQPSPGGAAAATVRSSTCASLGGLSLHIAHPAGEEDVQQQQDPGQGGAEQPGHITVPLSRSPEHAVVLQLRGTPPAGSGGAGAQQLATQQRLSPPSLASPFDDAHGDDGARLPLSPAPPTPGVVAAAVQHGGAPLMQAALQQAVRLGTALAADPDLLRALSIQRYLPSPAGTTAPRAHLASPAAQTPPGSRGGGAPSGRASPAPAFGSPAREMQHLLGAVTPLWARKQQRDQQQRPASPKLLALRPGSPAHDAARSPSRAPGCSPSPATERLLLQLPSPLKWHGSCQPVAELTSPYTPPQGPPPAWSPGPGESEQRRQQQPAHSPWDPGSGALWKPGGVAGGDGSGADDGGGSACASPRLPDPRLAAPAAAPEEAVDGAAGAAARSASRLYKSLSVAVHEADPLDARASPLPAAAGAQAPAAAASPHPGQQRVKVIVLDVAGPVDSDPVLGKRPAWIRRELQQQQQQQQEVLDATRQHAAAQAQPGFHTQATVWPAGPSVATAADVEEQEEEEDDDGGDACDREVAQLMRGARSRPACAHPLSPGAAAGEGPAAASPAQQWQKPSSPLPLRARTLWTPDYVDGGRRAASPGGAAAQSPATRSPQRGPGSPHGAPAVRINQATVLRMHKTYGGDDVLLQDPPPASPSERAQAPRSPAGGPRSPSGRMLYPDRRLQASSKLGLAQDVLRRKDLLPP